MYKIEKQPYGYKLTFSGFIQVDEMKAWVNDTKTALSGQQVKDFGVFVDMRNLKPLPEDAKAAMVAGQMLFQMKGMARSVVILNTPIIAMQFQRLAKESGIYKWERYLDVQTVKDYEKVGINWIVKSIDPDKKQTTQVNYPAQAAVV
jgi:hypothetical protein